VVTFEGPTARLWLAGDDADAELIGDSYRRFPLLTCTTCGQHYYETWLKDFAHRVKAGPRAATSRGHRGCGRTSPRSSAGTARCSSTGSWSRPTRTTTDADDDDGRGGRRARRERASVGPRLQPPPAAAGLRLCPLRRGPGGPHGELRGCATQPGRWCRSSGARHRRRRERPRRTPGVLHSLRRVPGARAGDPRVALPGAGASRARGGRLGRPRARAVDGAPTRSGRGCSCSPTTGRTPPSRPGGCRTTPGGSGCAR
jgi:hypothetical protein